MDECPRSATFSLSKGVSLDSIQRQQGTSHDTEDSFAAPLYTASCWTLHSLWGFTEWGRL